MDMKYLNTQKQEEGWSSKNGIGPHNGRNGIYQSFIVLVNLYVRRNDLRKLIRYYRGKAILPAVAVLQQAYTDN